MPVNLESNSYRVEVSGWDTSEDFFVEKTTLTWGRDGHKQITLKSDLREGCVVFVRLLQPMAVVNTLPIAYQAVRVEQADTNHGGDSLTRVSLMQLQSSGERSQRTGDSGTRAA